MSGDYSRIAFDPSQNYGGVWLQQGRPLTDRDWNDQSAAVSRRAQAGTLDANGPVVVSGATPDAFKIMPGLLIGRGRMYVDGLLADNHGTGLQKWDATLAELYGGDPVPYLKQPHLPGLSNLPTGGSYLVYLDVWNREVTRFEDPKLVEIAVGVDTTTRVQTVWQVKLLEIAATTTCATPPDKIPAWVALTAPSAGRLTTATAPVPNLDPCLVPPAGGYKGLENQLYRVEVHTAGPLGTATFKWSRDNASIEARLTRLIDTTHIVVDSVGKDSVLRFSDGDWIEITDDWRELNGQAGALHKITIGGGVDDATRTITLDKPLTISLGPVDGQGNLDSNRHACIRRWDQKGRILAQSGSTHVDLDLAASTGAIAVPAGGLSLRIEDGIIVTFSADPAGGKFHVGDYWTFAARSADASVEILDSAPPRGIHHHYAKLAVYTPPSGLEDCRPKEEECCCTITVSPGGDIQAAIDALPEAGGCVCLKTGIHTVPRGLSIARSNVKLVGECHGTIVRSLQQGAVLMIGGTAAVIEGIEISMIAFEQNPKGTTGAANVFAVVAATNVRRSAILDCGARSISGQLSIAIQLANTPEFRIARCRIEAVTVAIFASGLQTGVIFGPSLQTSAVFIDDNIIDLGVDIANSLAFGIVLMQISRSRIAGNSLRGVTSGIIVNGQIIGSPQQGATEVIISKNIIACLPAPFETTGLSEQVFGIDLAAHSSIVSQNLVQVPRGRNANTGIRVTGDNIDVIDNQIIPIAAVNQIISGAGSGNTGISFTGIQVGHETALTRDIRVAGNFVEGGRVGISVRSATTVIAESNMIELADGSDNIGIWFNAVRGGQIKGNRVTGTGMTVICVNGIATEVTGNTLAKGSIGISMQTETAPVIAQNRIDAMRTAGIVCLLVTGQCDIVGNHITSCGFGGQPGSGIMVFRIEGNLHVEANEVKDTGLSSDFQIISPLAIGIVGTQVLQASIENNTVGYTNPVSVAVANEHRALMMTCFHESQQPGTGQFGYPIQILGNRFTGPGRTALVEIQEQGPVNQPMRFERVFFSNNYCQHYPFYGPATRPQNAGTVTLFGRVATVMGNQIKATRPSGNAPVFASINFNGMPGPLIGNVTSGVILQHPQFPAPQNNFNLIV
jgi:hypothetical protein